MSKRKINGLKVFCKNCGKEFKTQDMITCECGKDLLVKFKDLPKFKEDKELEFLTDTLRATGYECFVKLKDKGETEVTCYNSFKPHIKLVLSHTAHHNNFSIKVTNMIYNETVQFVFYFDENNIGLKKLIERIDKQVKVMTALDTMTFGMFMQCMYSKGFDVFVTGQSKTVGSSTRLRIVALKDNITFVLYAYLDGTPKVRVVVNDATLFDNSIVFDMGDYNRLVEFISKLESLGVESLGVANE